MCFDIHATSVIMYRFWRQPSWCRVRLTTARVIMTFGKDGRKRLKEDPDRASDFQESTVEKASL